MKTNNLFHFKVKKAVKKIDKSRLIAINKENILVLEKIEGKSKYSLAGGIKKKKETDIQSLIRETYEEIGIQLLKKNVSYFVSKKQVTKQKQEIYKHYFVTGLSIENIQVAEIHKFKSAHWVPWYEALEFLDKQDKQVVALYFGQHTKNLR